MGRFRLIVFAAVAVVSLSAAIGVRARMDGDAEVPAAVLPLSIAPAVVVATRPTLSEILDILLRERPTASELAYSGGDFPSGSDEAYVAGILSRRNANKSLVHRISAALAKEGRRPQSESQLLS